MTPEETTFVYSPTRVSFVLETSIIPINALSIASSPSYSIGRVTNTTPRALLQQVSAQGP